MKKSAAVSLLVVLAVLLGSSPALAIRAYFNTWQGLYGPGGTLVPPVNSLSGDNANCAVCHDTTGGPDVGLNSYGAAFLASRTQGLVVAAALRAIENLDSVNLAGGTSNFDEIRASAQPGWTAGNNAIFDLNGGPSDFLPAPAGIGALDPAPAPSQANIGVSPPTLNFGTVEILTTATQTVTISNTGGQDLNVTSLTLGASPDFSLGAGAPATPFVVAPDSSVDVPVDYTPSAAVAVSSSLTVASNDPDQPQVSVALSGTGVPPAPTPACTITVNPPLLNFGAIAVGASGTQSVTVGNTGAADCQVNLVLTGSEDFALGAGDSFSVAPNATVSVNVIYTPSGPGADSGTLDVNSDDPNRPTVSVPLQGNGQSQANINVSPAALDFGTVNVGATATSTVTVRNEGGLDLTVNGLDLTGSPDFALGAGAPATPFVLSPNSSADVPVSYTPSAPGAASGSLVVASDDPETPSVTVALSGVGAEVAPPADACTITVNPALLSFGAIAVGASSTQSVTIGNTGAVDCQVDLVLTGSADFALGAGVLDSFSVAPDETVSVSVTYTPSGPGADSGTLDVNSDDPNRPTVSVPLSGSGVAEPAPGEVDLDIKAFKVKEEVELGEGKPVRIRLEVRNRGTVDEPRPATVVGMQNGVEVFRETKAVSDSVGRGATRSSFGPYMPTAAGRIAWTATIADDDPDNDTATAVTRVEGEEEDEDDD